MKDVSDSGRKKVNLFLFPKSPRRFWNPPNFLFNRYHTSFALGHNGCPPKLLIFISCQVYNAFSFSSALYSFTGNFYVQGRAKAAAVNAGL
jgi:hypothetical protein